MNFPKKGVSEIVSTVLIVMISIAAIGIIAAFIVPMIRNILTEENVCSDALSDFYLRTDSGYSCFDTNKKIISVHLTKGNKEIDYYGVRLKTFDDKGETSFTFSIPANFSTNEEKVFYLFEENDKTKRIELYPLIKVSKRVKECKSSSKVEFDRTSCNINRDFLIQKGVYFPANKSEDSIFYAPNQNITQSLVSYWSFDGDIGTTAYDLSGNNLNGIYYNGLINNNSCSLGYGSCVTFDGVDDYLGITNTAFNISTFSASLWVYVANQTTYNQGIVGIDNGYYFGWRCVYLNRLRIICQFGRGPYPYPNDPVDLYTPTNSLQANKWNHLVVTRDNTNGNVSIYINGNLSNSGISNNFTLGSSNFRLGVDFGGIRYLNGSIDEFMFFNKALTPAEVQDIYNNQSKIKAFFR